ncbi:MAG TPA: TonB-dependent siderophore receptor [Ideonella sp.]|nr:TonB-dependent siderophore receptor [Ideonella sp.]
MTYRQEERPATTRSPRRQPACAPAGAALNTLTFAALLALAAGPSTAAAQAAPGPQPAASAPAAEATLPVVRATASKEQANGPVDGYAARRSATATKTDTPLNEVPQSISVITADQIRDQNAQTMQEVLRYSAGVRSEMYGLDNRGDWFTLRGGSEGSVLLDGLRQPLSGWWGVVRNEPYAFERIEVLRGPASVIAGQNGPGGVVNLVSKRPQAEPLREVSVQLGENNHKQIALDLTGPLNAEGTLQYRLVALGKDSDTQVKHAFEKRQYLAPSLSWKPNSDTTFTAYAEYQKDETGNTNAFFPIEGTLTDAPNGKLPIDTFIGEPDWDTYGGTRKRLGYELEQRLGDAWTLRHHLRHDRVDGELRTMYAAWWEGFRNAAGGADPNGTYLNRIWYANDDRNRITNADLLLEGKLRVGRTQHTLLFGVDGMNLNSRHTEWPEGYATPLDVYNPVYGSFPLPSLDALTPAVSETRARQVGVLVQDQIKFDEQWVLVAGLRHDRSRTRTDDGDPQKDSATSKNLGLVHLANGGFSPYVSYSESFEPVLDTDAAGKPFKPKRGKQLEAGVKWAPADRRITAAAAVYQLKEKNRLTPDPSTEPDHIDKSIQRGEVTVKGLELEVAASLAAWDLLANYTYMDARQTSVGDDDPIYLNKQLSGIPRHSAALWALHKFGTWGLPGLKAGAGVRYTGKTSDGIDVTTTPAYTVLDLMVSYDTGPWRLALNVANATDKTYIATCLERGDCWFGSKRKAVVSAAYRW